MLWVWNFLLSFLYSLLHRELLTERSNHWGGKPFCMHEPNMEETRTIAAHAQSKTPSEVMWSVGWWHHKLTWSKKTRRCLAQYAVLHSQPAQRHTSNEAHVSDPGSNFTSDVERVQVKNKMKTVQSPESRTGRTVVTDDVGGDKQ